MNFKHLLALIRVRIQLTFNQNRKQGTLHTVISMIMVVGLTIASISSFFTALFCGIAFLPKATPDQMLFVWTGIAVAFIFIWLIGLMVELQQMEMLSLDKLLHLPISLREAFALNYTTSFFSTPFLMFAPMLVGLTIAMMLTRGWTMLVAPFLLAAFLFMITSFTYQFRGWLARLMENKRLRGTIMVGTTMGIVVLCQLPNLLTMGSKESERNMRAQELTVLRSQKINLRSKLDAQVAAGKLEADEVADRFEEEQAELDLAHFSRHNNQSEEEFRTGIEYTKALDRAIPIGWLPYGINAADEGQVLTPIICFLGMTTLGLVSLTLAFNSTIRQYISSGSQNRKPSKRAVSRTKKAELAAGRQDRAKAFQYWNIPFLNEHQTTIGLSTFRGLLRAPETKMNLMLPAILVFVFSTFVIGSGKEQFPPEVRPFVPLMLYFGTMFGLMGLLFNLFGTDRDGFRAYVLSPIERSDILVGKNVAMAPFFFAIATILIVSLQYTNPLSGFRLLASVVQLPIAFLVACLIGNTLSTFFPLGISRGKMKPVSMNMVTVLLMSLVMILLPILFAPSAILLGAEVLAMHVFETNISPLYLITSIIQLLAVVWFYSWMIKKQGEWLYQRETLVLEKVSNLPE